MLSTPLTPPSTVKRKKASKLNKFLKLLKSGCESCVLLAVGLVSNVCCWLWLGPACVVLLVGGVWCLGISLFL